MLPFEAFFCFSMMPIFRQTWYINLRFSSTHVVRQDASVCLLSNDIFQSDYEVIKGTKVVTIMMIYTIKIPMTSAAAAAPAAAAADRMWPAEKHAKIPLDSYVFRPRPTGRSVTAKKSQNTISFWCFSGLNFRDRGRPANKKAQNATRFYDFWHRFPHLISWTDGDD